MGTYPAYGYKRDPADKHHLVIDEDTAPIVRRIFEMRAAGTGFHAIAVILNEEAAAVVREIYRMRCSGMAYGKIAAALNEKSILSPRWH